jgi:hypothetical protein
MAHDGGTPGRRYGEAVGADMNSILSDGALLGICVDERDAGAA